MHITLLVFIIICFPTIVHLCNQQLYANNGTITFLSYENNVECTWIFNLTLISTNINYRSLLLTFRHFDTEFGHDELFIGEDIEDVSKYNSKLYRFSGSKLPDPCVIPLRGDILTRSIWMQFTSDQTNTGSGFIVDYAFLVNKSSAVTSKSQQIVIDAEIRHPLDRKLNDIKLNYPYPHGTILSPNYPQNYSNNIICRWHFYRPNSFLRLSFDKFNTELDYDKLTLYLGQNFNNHAMILYEWSGSDIDKKYLFIPNDDLHLVFNSDKSNNSSGFLINYEVIEKETYTFYIYDNDGIIHSKDYPRFMRTNIEYAWIIEMNNFNSIEINIIDIDINNDHDSLQIVTGDEIHTINNKQSFYLPTKNETKLILRTKHADDDYHYRGFNLTYKRLNRREEQIYFNDSLPCGKTFSNKKNGTIEFNKEILTTFDCLIFIDVDDGQNVYLRFDYFNIDSVESHIEIGLYHDPIQHKIYDISDTLPGTCFIANYSQIWIRFHASQYSLGFSAFRLFYSETIRWSTVTPEPYVETLNNNHLFPYRLISIPTNDIYHNLTQMYVWYIEAHDDEIIHVTFRSFKAINDRRICFHLNDAFNDFKICTGEKYPNTFHHIGSCKLFIKPEFVWILISYDIYIEKYKKITIINKIKFEENSMTLVPSVSTNPFVHIEWIISINNLSTIIFDVENDDGNTPAELIIPFNKNIMKRYSLGELSSTRFCHTFYTTRSSFRVIYKSLTLPRHNQKRLFRLNLYKMAHSYFYIGNFHYISFKGNQKINQWTVQGQYDNSTFLANLFSFNKDLLLETTANVNLSMTNSPILVSSSDFDVRYSFKNKSRNSDFVLVLYEQQQTQSVNKILSNGTSDFIETNDYVLYYIQSESKIFNSIDFIIIQADNNTIIRIYDLNINESVYYLLNSSLIFSNSLSSLIGLRFSIKSLNIKLELQSLKRTAIKLRYKLRTISDLNKNSYHCLITDINVCVNNKNRKCNESCSNWFSHLSTSMNNTKINHLWPYGLRGSVTFIIENTTLDDFEKIIYRTLRQSLVKHIRKFCWQSQNSCLSKFTSALRPDHIIIQNYEEDFDDRRLYVAVFIKDPYHQTIALTNDQLLLVLKRNQHEIYQDIKHHIDLPTNFLEDNSLDSIWLYGVCLLALLVLIVVILMLITILTKRRSQSTNYVSQMKQLQKIKTNLIERQPTHLTSTPVGTVDDENDQNSSSIYNATEGSETSKSTATANLLPIPTSYCYRPIAHQSYFYNPIESAIKQGRGNNDADDEPIPFIDDNLSTAPSRKSSACWSDRTSLSSRFSLVWKLNMIRSGAQNRSSLSNGIDKRRRSHRAMRYSIPKLQQTQFSEEL